MATSCSGHFRLSIVPFLLGYTIQELKNSFSISFMIKKWEINTAKQVGDYKIFTVSQEESVSPITGKTHSFFTIHAKDWVNVVALTYENKVVLVRQYRHGVHDVTIEVPAGGLEIGESPIETGLRELKEETGYVTDEAEYIGFVHPNPAIFNNCCHTILAKHVIKDTPQKLDSTEDIEVEEWELDHISDAILSGVITSPFTISAFALYSAYLRKSGSLNRLGLLE